MVKRRAPAAKRRYHMRQRAADAEATRRDILQAALELFSRGSYDEVTLEQIAERASVTQKTVLRRFRSKDALLVACASFSDEVEALSRVVVPGDLAGIVRVLAARYEESMDTMLRYIAVEARVPAVAQVLSRARRVHRDWLAEAFAPVLPRKSHPLHRRRVAELFAATEIYVWHSWRRHLGLGRKVAEAALEETLEALTQRWQGKKGRANE